MKVVHLLRKPCSEGTVAANVLRWGTGAINVDAARISATDAFGGGAKASSGFVNGYAADGWVPGSPLGRWPANLVLQHFDGCVQDGEKRVAGMGVRVSSLGKGREGNHTNGIYGAKASKVTTAYVSEDGTETIAAWTCAPGCPVAGLDAQSGVSKSTGGRTVTRSGGGNVGSGKTSEKSWSNDDPGFGDTGGASRFFKQVKA